MPFWSRNRSVKSTRLLYATDVHGSEPTYRKFINAGKIYDVDVLILGGDLTGKLLVPIVDLGNQRYTATLQSRRVELEGTEELTAFQDRLAKLGFYDSVVTSSQYQELRDDPDRVNTIFQEQAAQRLRSWVRLAEERLADTEIRCYVTGGNDDDPEILEVLEQESRDRVVPCEGKLVELTEEGHVMASLGYSNPTPWDTPREADEERMAELIQDAISGLENFSMAVFNFHAPPVDSALDTCPKLDPSTDPPTVITAGGEPVMFGAGSSAVREAIERYQPLLSLHGHIHESRGKVMIGRTTAVNPGSEYGEAILRGALVTLDGANVQSVQMTSG